MFFRRRSIVILERNLKYPIISAQRKQNLMPLGYYFYFLNIHQFLAMFCYHENSKSIKCNKRSLVHRDSIITVLINFQSLFFCLGERGKEELIKIDLLLVVIVTRKKNLTEMNFFGTKILLLRKISFTQMIISNHLKTDK